jgi:PAS domain S-box-containing protein
VSTMPGHRIDQNRLLEMIATGRPLGETLDALCHLVEQMSPEWLASILLVDQRGDSFWHGASTLPSSYVSAIDGMRASATYGPCGLAAQGEHVVASDIATDTRWSSEFRELALQHGLRACWSAPIKTANGKLLGVFEIYLRQPGAPAAQQQNKLAPFIHLAHIAIERAQAMPADVSSEILNALRHSEERHALAMEASGEGFWDWNIATGEYYVSPQMNDVLGFPAGTIFKNRSDFLAQIPFHPQDHPRWQEAVDDYFSGKSARFDIDIRIIPRGETRWVHLKGLLSRDASGKPVRWTGSCANITERKLAADALLESEARFRSLTELSSDWYWEQDENLRFTYLSNQALDLTGHSGESSIGKARWELANMTPLSCTWPEHQAVLAARQPFRDLETCRVGADGKTRYLSISGTPIFDEHGHFRGYHGIGRNITERKRIEEELRQSEQRFALAVEGSNEGIFDWDLVTDRVYMSRRAQQLFELTPGELWRSRSEWRSLVTVHPDDAQHLRDVITGHIAGQAPYDAEFRIVLPAGDIRWFRQRGIALRDASGKAYRIVGSHGDITDSKTAQRELLRVERSRQEMLDLAQKAAHAVAFDWHIDAKDGEHHWSSEMEAIYGLKPGTYDGTFKSWKTLVHPDDWPAVLEAVQRARDTGEVDVEYRVLHPGGVTRWLQARGRMLFDADGKPQRTVGFMLDVTDRHAAEDEVQRLEKQLRQSQRLEAMGTLAGGIAHDFNNILGAILGYGEMALRDTRKGSRLRRDLDSMMMAGERGQALVERILAFSRSAVGERVAVHVEKVVREALDLLSAKLPENVTLHAKLHAGSAAMQGDATQVHQVLTNLATNAVQAMPAGGTLRVSLDAVHLTAARPATIGAVASGNYLVLKVADTGSGIGPEILERIFDPFFTTKEVGTGTGLGLSLVHGIVTELGGAIDVLSTPGAGSEFTVYLPRSGNAADPNVDEEFAMPRGGGQRVMIVDDEEPLVRLTVRTLEELGYVLAGFTSSTAALAAFRADPDQFDAVITDERMPGLSGTALIGEVRRIRSTIPILLMSGYLGADIVRRARDAGADELLKKPLKAQDLATTLARALHH